MRDWASFLGSDPKYKAYMVLTLILLLKFVFGNLRAAKWRAAAGIPRAPEDEAWKARSRRDEYVPTEDFRKEAEELAARWRRITENDHENLLWGILIGGVTLVYVPSPIHVALYTVFALARLGHTICYAYSFQPWRSLSWVIGLLTTSALGVCATYYSFADLNL